MSWRKTITSNLNNFRPYSPHLIKTMASSSSLRVLNRRPILSAGSDAFCCHRAASTSASASSPSRATAPTLAPAPSSPLGAADVQESAPGSSASSSAVAQISSSSALDRIAGPTSNIGSKKLKAPLLHSLRALRASLFGQTYNPHNIRTGAKYLRKPLVGPKLVQYYPPQLSLKEVRQFLLSGPRLTELVRTGDPIAREDAVVAFEVADRMVATPYEVQRVEDVERRKALGKGPPKKGEGRRAAMKNKGKK